MGGDKEGWRRRTAAACRGALRGRRAASAAAPASRALQSQAAVSHAYISVFKPFAGLPPARVPGRIAAWQLAELRQAVAQARQVCSWTADSVKHIDPAALCCSQLRCTLLLHKRMPPPTSAEPTAVPCSPPPANAGTIQEQCFQRRLLSDMRHCKQHPPTNRAMKSASVRPKRSVASAVGSSPPRGCRNAALSVTGAACSDPQCTRSGDVSARQCKGLGQRPAKQLQGRRSSVTRAACDKPSVTCTR